MIVKAVRADENMTQIVWTFLEVRQPPLYPNIRSSVLPNDSKRTRRDGAHIASTRLTDGTLYCERGYRRRSNCLFSISRLIWSGRHRQALTNAVNSQLHETSTSPLTRNKHVSAKGT